MEQQLLQQPLDAESWGLGAHLGKRTICLLILLLTGHLPLAIGPAWSSARRHLHRTGQAAENMELQMGQMEGCERLKET